MKNELNPLIEFILKNYKKAGKISLKYYQKQIDVISKSDESPVTVADRETEIYLRKIIEKRFPDHGIIGEEYGVKEAKNSPFTWTLDPIDGTKSFIAGVPFYTLLISILKDKEPVFGMIYQPVLDELVWAAEGLGAFYQNSPTSVSDTSSLSDARMAYTDANMLISDFPKSKRLFESAKYARSWGDGYGYLLVATGRMDFMIDPRMNIWDIAPMKPIITEAVGRFTQITGEPSLGTNCIASNGKFHDELLLL